MSQGKILAFSGSCRRESMNRRLLDIVADKLQQAGAPVTVVDLGDFDVPLYNGDLEAEHGIPADAEKFYQLMKQHDGFLIACPEYNRSITPLLKNTIDWASRPRQGDRPLEAFDGKVAGLCSASAGRLGGLRGLYHVAEILQSIGTNVLPKQVAIGGFPQAFDEAGNLTDKMASSMMDALCQALVKATG
jgi:NAD(P)H-dependent FMN reductase